jgi:hypothetical protein
MCPSINGDQLRRRRVDEELDFLFGVGDGVHNVVSALGSSKKHKVRMWKLDIGYWILTRKYPVVGGW